MRVGDWRKLISHGVIYAVGALLARVVSFVMMPVYTRALSPAEYGIVDLLDTTAAIIVNVSSVAITYSVMRFYYDYDRESERGRVISTALVGLTLFGTVAVGLVWPLAPGLSHAMFHTSEYALALRVMAITAILYGLVEVPMTYIRALERPVLYLGVSLGRLLLGVALNIWFLLGFHWGVMGVVYANAGSSLAAVLALLVFTLPKTGVGISGRDLRGMLKFGAPFIPGSLAMLVLHNGDRYILNQFRPLSEIGIYSLGYKLGMILTYAISVPFGNVWSTRMYTVLDEPGGRVTYAKVSTYYVFILLFGWIALSTAAPEIVQVAASRQYAAAATLVPIIAGGYVLRESAEYWKNAFLIRKRTRTLGWVQPTSAVFNIAVTWFFVRAWGTMGAAWATALTFLFLLVLTAVLAERILPTGVPVLRIAGAVAIAGALLVLSGMFPHLPLAWAIAWKAVLVLSFPAALLGLRVVPRDDRTAAFAALARLRMTFSRPASPLAPRSSLNP